MAEETASDILKSFNYNQNSPGINRELRQRIALAMLQQKKAFPKNAGEGITAIGEALGENRLLNRLGQAEGESDKAANEAVSSLTGPAVAAPPVVVAPQPRASLASDDDVSPTPPPITRSVVSPTPPPVQQAAPGGLLSRADAGGIAGPYANNPAQAASLMNPQPTRIAPPTGGPLPTDRFQPQNQPLVPPPQGQMPVSTGGYNVLDQQANAPPTETNPDARALAAAALMRQQQNGPAVPLPNPTQGAAPPFNRNLVLSSDPAAGSLTGDMPANTMALASPRDFGIRQAPPAAPPVRTAQAGPVPGYVLTVPPEPVPPPTTTDTLQKIRNLINNTPPAHRDAVAEKLAPYVQQEQAKLGQLGAIYKDQMTQRHELIKLQEEQRATAAKRLGEAQEQQQKVQAGQHTTVEGRLMMPDPNKPIGSPWIDVTAPKPGQKGDGPPVLQKPLTAEQDHSQKFLTQMILAERQLEGKEHLLANSPGQAILNRFGGNALMNRNYLTAKNAADFSVAANLRDISGATIHETEQVRQYKMAMPVLGDPPSEIAAKRERRKAIMDSMYNGLGDARALVDYSKQEMIKRHDAEQAKINETMHAKLGPQPKGYVAKNAKTGESRVWDGKNWLDYSP